MTDTPLTQIHVSIKVVKNLGDFNSLHIEAGVTAPKRPDESFEDGFDRVYNAVESKIEEKIAEAVKELKRVMK